ncbi:hypothetical protein [Thalassotalea ganghwensis]
MKWIVLSVYLFMFTACNSEDIETANFGSGYYKNDYQLVNMTDSWLTLFIANTELGGEQRNPFEVKYQISNDVLRYDYLRFRHEHNVERKFTLGVQSSTAQYRQHIKVDNDSEYHLVVWQDNNQLAISSFKRANRTKNNYITVRLFSTQESGVVKLNDQQKFVEQGKVSQAFTLANCANELYFNDQMIDVCEGDYGRAYLLVIDQEEQLLVPEQ